MYHWRHHAALLEAPLTPPTKISATSVEAKQLLLGARLLIIVGALYVVSFLARGVFVDPAREHARFAQTMSEPRALVAGVVFIAAIMLHLVVAFALTQFARREAVQEGTIGFLLTTFGLVLSAAATGPAIYVYPHIASAFLHDNPRAIEIAGSSTGAFYLGTVLLQGFLVTIGSGFVAQALTKSRVPRWVGVVYAVAALLYTTPVLGFAAELFGSALLAVAGAGLLMNRGVARAAD